MFGISCVRGKSLAQETDIPNEEIVPVVMVLCLVPMRLFAWTDGQLLIWMDTNRGHALKPIAQRFENHLGSKLRLNLPKRSQTVSRSPLKSRRVPTL